MTDFIAGTVGFPIQRQKMASRVDMVELTDARHIPPSARAARHALANRKDDLRFSVQASQYFCETPAAKVSLKGDLNAYGGFQLSPEMLALWKRQMDFATTLDAIAAVLITPSSITPSAFFMDRMTAFFDAVRPLPMRVVWEPHGPWDSRQAFDFASRIGLTLAVDPLRDDPGSGDFAYFRLGPFSTMGSRFGAFDLERIAAIGRRFDTVCCVFDTRRALDDASNLKRVLTEGTTDEFDF